MVGEADTGKTSLILTFLNYSDKDGPTDINKKKRINPNNDFSLKIIKIDGEKVRLQLWDQG